MFFFFLFSCRQNNVNLEEVGVEKTYPQPRTTQQISTVFFLPEQYKNAPITVKQERLNLCVDAWKKVNPRAEIQRIEFDPKNNWVEIYEK